MRDPVRLDQPLTAAQIAAVAHGATLSLSDAAQGRIAAARGIVDALIDRGIRGYGINTGVGALCDVLIDHPEQAQLSRNILFSHACGVGAPLSATEARAVMAAQVNLFALGYSGIRPVVVDRLVALLNAGVVPLIPARGSVGYLTYGAQIGLLLIGEGMALCDGKTMSARDALARAGLQPLTLAAKEGLSLVNGTPCSTGLACLALDRLASLCDWADASAAMTYSVLGQQAAPFDDTAMHLRQAPEMWQVAGNMRDALGNHRPAILPDRTQDPMSLRAVPHVHGAVRAAMRQAAEIITRELHSASDNPTVGGTPDAPKVYSTAHAMGNSLAIALDQMAIAAAQLGMISERRTDRLVNPLVSGLPAFLARDSGLQSGMMIAQYTAAGLVAENRRLAAPASLDGGITSALQEDILPHPTSAAEKLHRLLDNLELLFAIELICAAQAIDLTTGAPASPAIARTYRHVRRIAPVYADDRPLNTLIQAVAEMLRQPSLQPEPVPA